MAFELRDDGTMDTVLACSECGEEARYNFDGGYDGLFDGGVDGGYDEFVEWAIEDAEANHECASDAFAAHRAEDPHCTCNDCIAYHFENPREKGDDDGVEYADPRDHREGRE